jgi:hypothetical protein
MASTSASTRVARARARSARLGQPHQALALAHEHVGPEFGLELEDAARHGRLRRAQCLRGPGEAELPAHGLADEAQLLQGHRWQERSGSSDREK